MDYKRRIELTRFYDHVIHHTQKISGPPEEKIGFIVANHTTQEMLPMLESLGNIGEIIGFIPKSSEADIRALTEIQKNYPVDGQVTKKNLKSPEFATKYLADKIRNFNGKVIIIDDGGYFAPAFKEISHHPDIADKLLGVVEGTENGHQKYELTAPLAQHPVISKARSPNKRPEDKQVGRSLVKMADYIMMSAQTKQIEDMHQIGVIGLGKIGMAAALELSQRGQKPYVWDTNPSVLAEAVAHELRVAPSLEHLLSECDMVICATGKKAIRGEQWERLKGGAVVACCTSADDELDLESLEEMSSLVCESDEVDSYTLPNGNVIKLLNHGNSVNFYQGRGVVSSTLSLSLAEYHAAAALMAGADNSFPSGTVTELDKGLLKDIAAIWLSHFTEYDIPEHLKDNRTRADRIKFESGRVAGHAI